jgi:hypothetical protein
VQQQNNELKKIISIEVLQQINRKKDGLSQVSRQFNTLVLDSTKFPTGETLIQRGKCSGTRINVEMKKFLPIFFLQKRQSKEEKK